jgi:hypothetical protein
MDTRRRDAGENHPKPELGTETVAVELIELQSVGNTGSRGSRSAILAVAALGIVAFGAILATGRLPSSTPSPSAPVVGLASATPTVPTGTPTHAPATFRPPSFAPTPIPTAAPPWQWTASDFLPELHPSVEGIWSVDGQALALISRYDAAEDRRSWSMARLVGNAGWAVSPAPSAIDQFFASTVFGGRLWFFAHIAGITEADATWRLVSTADGQAWDSLGTPTGLPSFDGASLLTRAGDSWVVVTNRGSSEGASNAAISWSTDGEHWKPAGIPSMRVNVGYGQAARIGDATVILGYEFDDAELAVPFVLHSTDGRTWQRSNLEPPSAGAPSELACTGELCIITLEPPSGVSTGQALMESADGVHWVEVVVDIPYTGPDAVIGRLTTRPAGFIALSGSPPKALLSTEGLSWRAVDVLPPDAQGYLSNLVVAGDSVIGLQQWDFSGESYRIWAGSLAAMGN